MTDFLLTIGCKGYNSKSDPTNIDDNFLVAGSQNMVINDKEKVESRAGYELLGVANTTANPIKSEFSWKNSTEGEILLREINGVLEFYSTASTWETLLTGLSTTKPVRFASAWNVTELIDILLFVNNSSILYEWSGGQTTFASATATTITKQGTGTWAASRFLTAGTRQFRVKTDAGVWTTVTYTGGEGTTTLTGLDVDLTALTIAAGNLVIQEVRSNANKPASGFTNDVIKVFQNQAFIGSHTSQRLYVSSNTDYTVFTSSTPRIAGEGAIITLDASIVGLEVPGTKETESESKVIVFCNGNRGYEITLEISPGSTADREVPRVKPLALSGGQGAQSQELIAKVKKTIVWLSNDNELLDLGAIQSETFDDVTLSDPLQPDFDNATFTNGDIKYFDGNIYITAPVDGKMYIFNVPKKFWQPPQVLGMRKLSVYSNLLYGHSNAVSETYKLFTTLADNDNPISFKAHFAYRNAGKRANLKNFDRFFTELYIQANTIVTCKILFEWKGAKGITTYELDGSDSTFLYTPVLDASLGVNPLGTNPLGGLLEAGEDTPKYRRFRPIKLTDHFEYQVRLENDGDDQAFQILATGANVQLSNNLPVLITK